MKIKILLVEDDQFVRESSRVLLEKEPDLTVVGEADNGVDAVAMAMRLVPHVVVMDIGLRGSAVTGQQATRKITTLNKEIKVIALSGTVKTSYVREMVSAGASGYLTKRDSTDELIEAIHSVMQGKHYFGGMMEEAIRVDYVDMVRNPRGARKNELSEREFEILRLTALGDNSKEIAGVLNISPKTVDTHKRKIREKLKLESTIDLVKYAIREKIIQADE